MSKFNFMDFGYDGGGGEQFVAHAKKYTAEQTIELCLREFEHKFNGAYGPLHRKPRLDDIEDGFCAFRFGVYGWDDGCYTFVGEGEPGAFPVWVITFRNLLEEKP